MDHATRQEAFDFAQSLPDEYLQCRDLGHLWRPFTATWDSDIRAYLQTLQCGRCTTRRVRYLSGTGAVLRGHYDYVEGYVHKNLGRLTGDARDALRLEGVIRTVDGSPRTARRRANEAWRAASA